MGGGPVPPAEIPDAAGVAAAREPVVLYDMGEAELVYVRPSTGQHFGAQRPGGGAAPRWVELEVCPGDREGTARDARAEWRLRFPDAGDAARAAFWARASAARQCGGAFAVGAPAPRWVRVPRAVRLTTAERAEMAAEARRAAVLPLPDDDGDDILWAAPGGYGGDACDGDEAGDGGGVQMQL